MCAEITSSWRVQLTIEIGPSLSDMKDFTVWLKENQSNLEKGFSATLYAPEGKTLNYKFDSHNEFWKQFAIQSDKVQLSFWHTIITSRINTASNAIIMLKFLFYAIQQYPPFNQCMQTINAYLTIDDQALKQDPLLERLRNFRLQYPERTIDPTSVSKIIISSEEECTPRAREQLAKLRALSRQQLS